MKKLWGFVMYALPLVVKMVFDAFSSMFCVEYLNGFNELTLNVFAL